jgi:hypothetical protein
VVPEEVLRLVVRVDARHHVPPDRLACD